jgi:UDP-glucose 4-epimerase
MKKILVTGAGGWLGAEVARALGARGDAVVLFDLHAPAGAPGTAVAGDICSPEQVLAVFREHRPDAVVHCAAIVGAAAAENVPLQSLRVNVEGMVNLLEAMRQTGVRRVVNISTEEVYGDFNADMIDESHPHEPSSVYGLTKHMAEEVGRFYARRDGIECINVRTCWVYGPGLPRARVPKTFIDAALDGVPFHLASGAQMRVDQVHSDDTVAGVLLALDKPTHRFDSYHIATGTAPSLREVAQIVNRAVPGAAITTGEGDYLHAGAIATARKGALDIGRARTELGYEPRFDIKRGIEATIDACRAVRDAHTQT